MHAALASFCTQNVCWINPLLGLALQSMRSGVLLPDWLPSACPSITRNHLLSQWLACDADLLPCPPLHGHPGACRALLSVSGQGRIDEDPGQHSIFSLLVDLCQLLVVLLGLPLLIPVVRLRTDATAQYLHGTSMCNGRRRPSLPDLRALVGKACHPLAQGRAIGG